MAKPSKARMFVMKVIDVSMLVQQPRLMHPLSVRQPSASASSLYSQAYTRSVLSRHAVTSPTPKRELLLLSSPPGSNEKACTRHEDERAAGGQSWNRTPGANVVRRGREESVYMRQEATDSYLSVIFCASDPRRHCA